LQAHGVLNKGWGCLRPHPLQLNLIKLRALLPSNCRVPGLRSTAMGRVSSALIRLSTVPL
jgi:hypothetical protein